MTAPATLNLLSTNQNLLVALVEGVDDSVCRRQFHPDLSPLGWHLGHCVYMETYWLQEVVAGDASQSAPYRALYTPKLTPRPQRGPQLPARDTLLDWAVNHQSDNLMRLANPTPALSRHSLLKDDYLPLFLAQHHALHYEYMLMVLTQRALHEAYSSYLVRTPLIAGTGATAMRTVPAGHYRIGGATPLAFDNELPPQHAQLGEFRIAALPVSNSEYLAFMESGGYADARLWSDAGGAWRVQHAISHPDHWRRDASGAWYGVGMNGPYDLAADAPVQGVNHFEASAYAAWSGGRLPHEFQWEAAYRANFIADSGRVFEWCANTFHPYQGFRAFPNETDSTAGFDSAYYTLRGASLHTRPELRRASFRKFHSADQRHMFSGFRLVY